MSEALRQRVSEQIESAFKKKNSPPPGKIHNGRDYTDFVEKVLQWQRWFEVSVHDLQQTRECLPFMTPKAVHYYLSAYLRFVLFHPQEADTLREYIIEYLTFALTPKAAPLFSLPQIEAIIAFLEAYPQLYLEENSTSRRHKERKASLENMTLTWWMLRDEHHAQG